MIDLSSKTVLITGGSRGIGKACVELFAAAKAGVAFTYNKNRTGADEIINTLRRDISIKAYHVDFEKIDMIEDTASEIISDFGKIDVLVNNAGIWKYGESDKMSLDEWRETIGINLTGTFLFTKSVIPSMKKNNFGRIINITSTAGQRGEAFHSHYAASKGGIISFTKSLAAELGPFNITVNSVAPGWVLSDMTAEVFSDEEYREKVTREIPLKRIAEPVDIAGPVLFLASDMAKHITGEILNVNGGSVLCG